MCDKYGDPALTLPLIYTPRTLKRTEYGIVPHLHDLQNIKSSFPNERIINLSGEVERIIDEINSCGYIISTSLHGIIVAHAYGIPAIWVKEGYIYTDGIKFKDYFASVGIPLYDGADFKLNDFIGKRYEELHIEIKSLMLPHKSLIEVQRDIINSAPFEIKQNIKNKIL